MVQLLEVKKLQKNEEKGKKESQPRTGSVNNWASSAVADNKSAAENGTGHKSSVCGL